MDPSKQQLAVAEISLHTWSFFKRLKFFGTALIGLLGFHAKITVVTTKIIFIKDFDELFKGSK